MEAGVDPTNFRLAAYLLVNSANIIYGCLHTRIETTFCRLSALCNWVTKENTETHRQTDSLFNGRSHTRREVRLSIVWHALSDPTDACWLAGAIYWQVYIAVARLID